LPQRIHIVIIERGFYILKALYGIVIEHVVKSKLFSAHHCEVRSNLLHTCSKPFYRGLLRSSQ
jgi:hypothetical protein